MKKLYSLALEQKEDSKHGDSFFPIQRYITTLDNNYPVITAHWHEEAELTMITSGFCKYQIDLVDFDVKEWDILFNTISHTDDEPGIFHATPDYV